MPGNGSSKSGDPRKRAAAAPKTDKYAATTWSANHAVLEDIEVPSGQMCQVRRPGVQGLVKAKVLDNVDSLSALVKTKHIDRVAGKPEPDVEAMLEDPETIAQMLEVVDKVVEYIVVQPHVERPIVEMEDGETRDMEADERIAGVIYTDMIELEDRMFLLNYACGGTRDVETFRRESAEHVGRLDQLENVGSKAK